MERLQSQTWIGRERPVAVSVERMVSQKAMQAATSSPCVASAVGFLCGVCLTYILVASVMPFRSGIFSFDGVHVYLRHGGVAVYTRDEEPAQGTNFSKLHHPPPTFTPEDLSYKGRGGKLKDDGEFMLHKKMQKNEKVTILHSLWEAFYINSKNKTDPFWNIVGVDWSNVPKAPHINNCKDHVEASKQLDTRGANESRPSWSIWKGYLGLKLHEDVVPKDKEEELLLENRTILQGTYPPWVEGGDEDNLPMTTRVQWDLWLHQHPRNCHDPHLKFLFTDWESSPGLGIVAQIASMAGMLALAVNQNRILVTNYFNRADHNGCKGSKRSHWSCYFLPETSAECREHALELALQADAWKQGIITSKENYTTKDIWVGRIPRQWGKTWESMQPTTEINSKLLMHH